MPRTYINIFCFYIITASIFIINPIFASTPQPWPPKAEKVNKEWNTMFWEEFSIKFKYPKNWKFVISKNKVNILGSLISDANGSEKSTGSGSEGMDSLKNYLKISQVSHNFRYSRAKILNLYETPNSVTAWDSTAGKLASSTSRIHKAWGMYWNGKNGDTKFIRLIELVTGEVFQIELNTKNIKKHQKTFQQGRAIIESFFD